MDKWYDVYLKMISDDREITKQMVESGELSEEEGEFRDWMREDEILWDIPDELFE